jgi:hypothetical protein
MNTAEVFPSKYLKADDLDGDVEVTIKEVRLEALKTKSGEDEQKPIVYFSEGEKGLVCNRTNWNAIVKQHGDESDLWVGKKVTLTVVDVDAFGEVVPALRIKPPKKASSGSAFPKAIATPQKTTPTDFWKAVKLAGFTTSEGQGLLQEVGGDWDKALDAVEQLIPPASERE